MRIAPPSSNAGGKDALNGQWVLPHVEHPEAVEQERKGHLSGDNQRDHAGRAETGCDQGHPGQRDNATDTARPRP